MTDFRQYIRDTVITNKNARILEIGPLNRPIAPKAEFQNVVYCDIRSTDEVKAVYGGNDYLEITGISVDLDTIVDIDQVLRGTYEETFTGQEKFDFVLASHVMEHVEDLLGTLRDIATVLAPDGLFIMLYPDKRYSFDHFRESSSMRDAYDVFRRGVEENARMAFDFYFSAIAENMPHVFWRAENMPDALSAAPLERAADAFDRRLRGEQMDDVHFWPFTDESFLRFLYDGLRSGLLPYACTAFMPTEENSQEFFVALSPLSGSAARRGLAEEALKAFMRNLPDNELNARSFRKDEAIQSLTEKLTAQDRSGSAASQALEMLQSRALPIGEYILSYASATNEAVMQVPMGMQAMSEGLRAEIVATNEAIDRLPQHMQQTGEGLHAQTLLANEAAMISLLSKLQAMTTPLLTRQDALETLVRNDQLSAHANAVNEGYASLIGTMQAYFAEMRTAISTLQTQVAQQANELHAALADTQAQAAQYSDVLQAALIQTQEQAAQQAEALQAAQVERDRQQAENLSQAVATLREEIRSSGESTLSRLLKRRKQVGKNPPVE